MSELKYTEVIMVMFSYEKQVLAGVSQSESLQEGISWRLKRARRQGIFATFATDLKS